MLTNLGLLLAIEHVITAASVHDKHTVRQCAERDRLDLAEGNATEQTDELMLCFLASNLRVHFLKETTDNVDGQIGDQHRLGTQLLALVIELGDLVREVDTSVLSGHT